MCGGARRGAADTQQARLGMVAMARSIVHEEGAGRLLAGLAPAVLRHVVYTGLPCVHAAPLSRAGLRMPIYEVLRDALQQHNHRRGAFPLHQSVVAGMLSGAVAQLAASPTDLVKACIRMTRASPTRAGADAARGAPRPAGTGPAVLGAHVARQAVVTSQGMWAALAGIYRSGGARALWKGCVPNVQASYPRPL